MYVENILCLIFLLFDEYENFLTTKISRITAEKCAVYTYCMSDSLIPVAISLSEYKIELDWIAQTQ